MSNPTPQQITRGLQRWVMSDSRAAAAVSLLEHHGYWLPRLFEEGLLTYYDTPKAGSVPLAKIQWKKAVVHPWTCSSEQLRVLKFACSLGSAEIAVNLRDITYIKQETLMAMLKALNESSKRFW